MALLPDTWVGGRLTQVRCYVIRLGNWIHSTRNIGVFIAVAATFGCLRLAIADEVMMRNGDRLTGDLIRQNEGRLRLKTTYAGTLDIDWAQVQSVELDEPSEVLLDDESILSVEAVSRDDDQVTLQLEPPSSPITVHASRVKVIEPEPWETGKGYKLGGGVNTAIEDERGNSESSELDLDFNFDYRRRWDRFESYGELEYDTTRGIRSSDNWSWLNNYNRLSRSQWYASGFFLLKHDRFADLYLRKMVGPALGYQFYERSAVNLRAEGGFYYLADDFYDQPDRDFWGPGWYINYDQHVWKRRLQLYHRQLGFAAADSSGKDLWRSWTGVRVPLLAGIVASFEYEIDFDNAPAVETEPTDQTFRLKLGYKW